MARPLSLRLAPALLPIICLSLSAQEQHGRKYKPPPPTATVTVTVDKAFNGTPMPNASVVFHSVFQDQNDANLEMKTDPDGKATMDLLAVGSHVTVQVIADGYATYATDFELPANGKNVLVRLERPRAQVSVYGDDADRPAQVQPGVQEHRPDAGKPQTAPPPAPVSPTGPVQTTPPANTPATVPAPGTSPSPATPGSPQ